MRVFSRDTRQRCNASFTLIELMMVLVVMSILAGITISVSKYAGWRAASAKQDVDLEKIRMALDEYRAVNGEYPIVGDPKHYARKFVTECAQTGHSPWTNVDLVISNAIENMSGMFQVDHSLTYPLLEGPLSKGREPYIILPNVTICRLSYKDIGGEKGRMTYGSAAGVTYWFLTYPVRRYKAVDPVTGNQWKYVCTDGVSYQLQTNKF